MKFCKTCNKIYDDAATECKRSYHERLLVVPSDAPECKCKDCGSTENIVEYRESWKAGSFEFGNYFTCKTCAEKREAMIARESQMKYLILNNEDNETEFCDSSNEVDRYLEKYKNYDYCEGDSRELDIVILKLDILDDQRGVTADMFKNPENTHLVFWDDEMYRVENVSVPEISYEGDLSLSW